MSAGAMYRRTEHEWHEVEQAWWEYMREKVGETTTP